ncbi:MAG: haloacid dehalogenase-like hydrolase [Deltaproteobacteria bacterium]|nr:haloacid dehalogenase-like hydrolase [Deltaproteobacteria bacterium]
MAPTLAPVLPANTTDLPPLADPADRARVEAAIESVASGEWIASDADETLWAADVGDEVVRLADLGAGPWPARSADFAWYSKEMTEGDYAGACRYAARLLHGHSLSAVRSALQPALSSVQLRPWLARSLQRARGRGVRLAIVSASPTLVVEFTSELLQFPVDRVIGLELRDGEVVEPASIGFGKVTAWQRAGLPQPKLALGDSRWDGPLLAAAQVGLRLVKASHDRER